MDFMYRFMSYEYQLLEDYLNHKASLGLELKTCTFFTFKQSDNVYYYFVNPTRIEIENDTIEEMGTHRGLYIYRSKHQISLEHDKTKKPIFQLLLNIFLLLLLIAVFYFITPNDSISVKFLTLINLNEEIHHLLVQNAYLIMIIGICFFILKKLMILVDETYSLIKRAVNHYQPSLTLVFIRSLASLLLNVVGVIFIGFAILTHFDFEKKVTIPSSEYPIITLNHINGYDHDEMIEVHKSTTPFCDLYLEYQSKNPKYVYVYYEMKSDDYASMVYRSLVKGLWGEEDPTYNSLETTRLFQFANMVYVYQKENKVFYFSFDNTTKEDTIKQAVDQLLSHSY